MNNISGQGFPSTGSRFGIKDVSLRCCFTSHPGWGACVAAAQQRWSGAGADHLHSLLIFLSTTAALSKDGPAHASSAGRRWTTSVVKDFLLQLLVTLHTDAKGKIFTHTKTLTSPTIKKIMKGIFSFVYKVNPLMCDVWCVMWLCGI